MDYPRFSTADVADAAGVPAETLRTWIKRGDITLVTSEPDQFTPGTGRNRLFTFKRTLSVVLTAELLRLGLAVKTASTLATRFTDTGEAVGYWGDEEPDLSKTRRPGELFKDDQTIFVVRFPYNDDAPEANVERLKEATKSPFWVGSRKFRSALFVNLDHMVEQVRGKLNVISD